MVKGVTRRVVVVRCPDTKYFDQAIFMVREDRLTEEGRSPEQVLAEACRVADRYLRQNTQRRSPLRRFLLPGIAALTALLALALFLFPK
jgi:hypothetical protein